MLLRTWVYKSLFWVPILNSLGFIPISRMVQPCGNSVQFSPVAQSCPTLCDPVNCSTPGLPVHHQLPEFTQTHVHWVGGAIQPSHPLSSPSPPAILLSRIKPRSPVLQVDSLQSEPPGKPKQKDPCKVLQAGKSSIQLRKEEKENGARLQVEREWERMAAKCPVKWLFLLSDDSCYSKSVAARIAK